MYPNSKKINDSRSAVRDMQEAMRRRMNKKNPNSELYNIYSRRNKGTK